MTYSFTVHNPAEFTDDEIAEGVAYGNLFQLEVLPDDPPTTLEDALAAHKTTPERLRRTSVRVRDADGKLVASTGIRIDPEHDDNPDMLWGSVNVLADHRGNGVGTKLLSYLVALAKRENRTRIVGGTNERIPAGAEFAMVIGAESKQEMHLNHLPIAEVDRALMEQWVAEGPTRAPDYELFGWDGPVPEEHMERYLAMVLIMNTAPRDDLEMNDFTITAPEVREGEKQMEAIGIEHWTLVARRKSDGVWAGFHDMSWVPSDPANIYVGATGVDPEHRGHALGKWLKATMQFRVLDEKPGVDDVRTGNADSNDAMLGINKLMGYRPLIGSVTWELPTEKAAAWLAERGVELPAV